MAKARSNGLVRLQYPMTSISNVLLVESLNFNLLSVAQLCDLGFKCIFGVDDVEIISVDSYNLIFKDFRYENLYVAEAPNLMPHRSARLPLDTKHSRENTKLLDSAGHTLGENPKIHIFPSRSQMRE